MRMFELKERESTESRRAVGKRKFQLDGSDSIAPSSKLLVLMSDLDTLRERSKELEKPLKRHGLLIYLLMLVWCLVNGRQC